MELFWNRCCFDYHLIFLAEFSVLKPKSKMTVIVVRELMAKWKSEIGVVSGVISSKESEEEESERFHFFRFRLRLRPLCSIKN